MSDHVTIEYTNYRGERGRREIIPIQTTLRFSSTEFHPEQQWLMDAFDVKKEAYRTFAMKDIHSWTPVNAEVKLPQKNDRVLVSLPYVDPETREPRECWKDARVLNSLNDAITVYHPETEEALILFAAHEGKSWKRKS